MYNTIARIDYFAGVRNVKSGIILFYAVNSLTHNLGFTLDSTDAQFIAIEHIKPTRIIFKKTFKFLYGIQNILQMFYRYSSAIYHSFGTVYIPDKISVF